jgi:hypothetical protein
LSLFSVPDAIYPDRPCNILYPPLSFILKQKAGLALQLIADTPGDVYLARFCESL